MPTLEFSIQDQIVAHDNQQSDKLQTEQRPLETPYRCDKLARDRADMLPCRCQATRNRSRVFSCLFTLAHFFKVLLGLLERGQY